MCICVCTVRTGYNTISGYPPSSTYIMNVYTNYNYDPYNYHNFFLLVHLNNDAHLVVRVSV